MTVKVVVARIRRNSTRTQSVMSREIAISRPTMPRVLNHDLGLRAYKQRTGHFLTAALREQRVVKAKRLLKHYAGNGHRSMLFSDEKVFTVEQCFNAQNDRVYASSSQQAATRVPRVQRSHHPASVMVWWGVSFNGTTQLHFCEQGVKTSAHVYQTTVLEPIVKPLNTTMFPNAD